MDSAFAKNQFKSLMVQIRFLSENADAELTQTMLRELGREIGELERRVRTGNQFLKNSVADNASTVIESRPTG